MGQDFLKIINGNKLGLMVASEAEREARRGAWAADPNTLFIIISTSLLVFCQREVLQAQGTHLCANEQRNGAAFHPRHAKPRGVGCKEHLWVSVEQCSPTRIR